MAPWISKASEEFHGMTFHNNPVALVVLAHWAASLVKRVDESGRWYLLGAAHFIVTQAANRLPMIDRPTFQKLIEAHIGFTFTAPASADHTTPEDGHNNTSPHRTRPPNSDADKHEETQPESHTRYRRWTPQEESQLVRLRLTERKEWSDIAQALNRTSPSVQTRYRSLRNKTVWTEEEDEEILRAWKELKEDEELVDPLNGIGGFYRNVGERRKQLCKEMGPVYKRVMGMDEHKPVQGALEKAVGKKHGWMD
ncbi:hypothetical protein EKO04_000782 [Ascochyta lentis]|uniref:Myb-like domain-containing protein n=1 Tax=Ascochyta lentis TaxID=205686 RepID=A0A8H7JE86_9PLEO|nr:hypothetical protein EKO04_000782 [Ascochyta lentis]